MPSQRHAKAAASTTKQKTASTPTLIPDWPLLQPLVPSEDLFLEVLLQDQIIVIRNLFTSTLCKHYVSFLSSLPLVTTPAKPKHGEALRVNDRFEVHDPAFAEQLWNSTALKHLVTGVSRQDEEQMDGLPKDLNDLWGGESCGLNPRIRIYRYRKGQFFGQHCAFSKFSIQFIVCESLLYICASACFPPSLRHICFYPCNPAPTFPSPLVPTISYFHRMTICSP